MGQWLAIDTDKYIYITRMSIEGTKFMLFLRTLKTMLLLAGDIEVM